jgi:CheY-like chemotaxis protein
VVRTRPRRILLVDDNASLLEAMASLLVAMGHDVRTAADAAGAIAAARGFRPHVVLLDIGLPDGSGYDVARAMRGDPILARVVIVALTGYGREQDVARARAAGIDHHFTKPIGEEVLEALIDSVAAG